MPSADDGGRSVVLLDSLALDQPLLTEIPRHRRARIGHRVLDVRPVDILAREPQVRVDRRPGVVRVADDEATDDVHSVLVDEANGIERRVARAPAALAFRVLASRAEKLQVL